MEGKKERVHQLLANNKLLIGNHEPRSALIDKFDKKGSSPYEWKSTPSVDSLGDMWSIFGDYNLGTYENRTKNKKYYDYFDHKSKERKQKKHSR